MRCTACRRKGERDPERREETLQRPAGRRRDVATTTVTAGDRDAEKFVLPANVAVSECVPVCSEDVVSQAWPFWISAEPINVPLSRKLTVPIGAIADVTVARSMIGVPVEAEV